MPDLGQWVECNCCGKAEAWNTRPDGAVLVKVLPKGWTITAETIAGAAYFCSLTCESVWKNGREWQVPYMQNSVVEYPTDVIEEGIYCECGDGPFKDRRGLHGHRNSYEHKRRMGMDISQMKEPDRHKRMSRAAKRGRRKPKPKPPKYEEVAEAPSFSNADVDIPFYGEITLDDASPIDPVA